VVISLIHATAAGTKVSPQLLDRNFETLEQNVTLFN
jgi:hypothetical protein